MRLNPPKKFTFWSSLVIFVLGMIVAFHLVPFIPANYGVIAVFVGTACCLQVICSKGSKPSQIHKEDEGSLLSSSFVIKRVPARSCSGGYDCTLRAFSTV